MKINVQIFYQYILVFFIENFKIHTTESIHFSGTLFGLHTDAYVNYYLFKAKQLFHSHFFSLKNDIFIPLFFQILFQESLKV